VLDDYSPLREMTDDNLNKEAFLFPTRKALQYNQIMGGSGSSGGSTYVAKNPNYGATITYHLSETPHVSLKDKRQKMERKLKNSDIPFPGWEALDKELSEAKAEAILMIKDNNGNIVDQISGPLRKGTHRVTWGLRTSKSTTVNVSSGSSNRQRWGRSRGIMTNVNPGTYYATLYKRVGGDLTKLSDPVSITVERIRENVLKNPNADKHEQYNTDLAELTTSINKSSHVFMKAMSRVATYERNLNQVKTNKEELTKAVYLLRDKMNVLDREFSGSAAKAEIGEKDRLNIMDRLMKARGGWYPNSYGPTELHMQSFEIAKQMYESSKPKIDSFVNEVRELGKLLEDAGGPIYLD
jgi:hypothetical protein